MTLIYDTDYKGISAICLETANIRAIFLPNQGAKLCSLIWKRTGREYIYQGKTTRYQIAQYGQNYLLGECAGMDEMFPTIDACYYDHAPWEGIFLPDHGEVWALPWNYEVQEEKLIMMVKGVKLPYELWMSVAVQNDDTLHMEYEARNLSTSPMEYIWAAHMMLAAEEGCRFEFAADLKKAYAVMSDSGTIGRPGDVFEYPYVKQENGAMYDASRYRGNQADDYQKFYFADKLKAHQGWGRICYPDESKLTIAFPPKEVPYLGAIQAEGGSLNLRCMFLEPCTGAFDSLQKAREYGMNSVLGAEEKKRWSLDIKINQEEEA